MEEQPKPKRRFSRRRVVLAVLRIAATILLRASIASGYVQFEPVLVPETPQEKNSITCSPKVTYGLFNKETVHKVARTTEDHNCILPGCQRIGEVLDIQRYNVSNFDRDTLGSAHQGQTKVDFSHYPSGGVLLQEEDIGRWFMLYQFEKPNPGTVYRMRMRLENDTNLASRLNVPLNFAPFGGLWRPRAAIPTPTNTMMGTEGVPPDGKLFEDAKCLKDSKKDNCLVDMDREGFEDIVEFMRYFGKSPTSLLEDGKLELPPSAAIPGFKIYRYGYPYEVGLTVNEDDRVVDKISKLYALGRTGAQGISVMQDGYTIYISGARGTLFRFVADSTGRNYQKGELSAAVVRLRVGPEDPEFEEIQEGTTFTISWIPLGTTNAEDIAGFVSAESTLTFGDMFEYAEPHGGQCPNGLELIRIKGVSECLRVLDGDLASVFEPERTAAVLGATVGVFYFSQMATKLDSDRFYLGVGKVEGGSVQTDQKGPDVDVSIPPNDCGCVFEVSINDAYTAHTMRAISCGRPVNGAAEDPNLCSTEKIANPRALTYVNAFEYLLIGEDSQKHENNMVWAWDPQTEKITRIFHAAALGGITSLTWSQDVVGGNNYVGITISKPVDVFGWLSYFGSFDLTVPQDMSFSGIPVPYAKGPKRLPISFKRATKGVSETYGTFKTLFKTGVELRRTGANASRIVLGEVVSRDFQPVKSYKKGPVRPLVVNKNEIRHRFAFTSLIDMCSNLFSIAVVDSIPGVSYTVSLKEDKQDALKAISAEYNDWGKWGGLWQSGGGTVTPWNSHLGGEVDEPDGLDFLGFPCLTGFSSCFKSKSEQSFEKSILFVRYFNSYFDDFNNKFSELQAIFNPYNYGYAYEIEVNKFGCSATRKLMTLGRFSHGDISIMPDQRTVYMLDHTTGRDIGGGFFRFIAKRAGDLTSGTLYAAKLKPVLGTLEKFTISWIELASASNGELFLKSNSLKFTDMFEYIPAARNCRLRTVNVKSTVECLDHKKDAEKWGAFFETRRFAALKGATIEFANAKGLTFDRNTNKLFMSINRISRRDKIMLQDDVKGSSNNVKVPSAECGVLYEMQVTKTGTTEYDTKTFRMFYRGRSDFGAVGANKCNVENAANPGALSSIPGHNQFLVAEDSCKIETNGRGVVCGHENNALWSMDPFVPRNGREEDREKTRILTAPPLTSVDSIEWYPKVGGVSVISAAVNELYGAGFDNLVDREQPEAVFGYMGPFQSKKADLRRPEIKAVKAICNSDPFRKASRFHCPNKPVKTT